MSVIVHGWKVPTDCGGCAFMHEDVELREADCRCGLNRMANVTNNFYNGNRPDWCPLEESPDNVNIKELLACLKQHIMLTGEDPIEEDKHEGPSQKRDYERYCV